MIYQKIQEELERRKAKSLYRTLSPPHGIDFSSNDYLGLSQEPKLIEAFQRGLKLYGLGSTASRLIRGHRNIIEEWENQFARFLQTKDALMVANGFTANLGLIDALSDKQTIIFTDRLNHASILDGIRLSGAKRIYYRHLDLEDLKNQLEKYKSHPKKILVSETVFSMDGDILPVEEYIKLAKDYQAITILDESHAFGVFGNRGQGISYGREVDFRIYTMGKALGLEGGMIVCSHPLAKDFLINCMRNFVFSTAPMPAVAYTALEALDILMSEPHRIQKVLTNAKYIIDKLQFFPTSYLKFNSDTSQFSQIIPILLPSEEVAILYSQKLKEKGLDVRAIRPPTVPTPRLRISVHSHHTLNELYLLAESLQEIYFSLQITNPA